jgi:uncharacterized protein YecE (DUF72 family)
MYRIGISGWTYEGWRGDFYPEGLRHDDELGYAASKLNSIEINGTFYSLQRPGSYASWRDRVPEDFVFSVKAPRFITHMKRLKDVAAPVANFFASGLLRLGEKLGPILWQLPPSLALDPERLERFLDLLPHDTRAAARLARKHDSWMKGRVWLEPEADAPVRHALEVRHASFDDPRVFRMLGERGVALVVADTAGEWPYLEERTADFIYARLHGDEKIYVSGYTEAALRRWAERFRRWTDGERDAFVYFDNDVKVRAPYDAMELARLLSRPPKKLQLKPDDKLHLPAHLRRRRAHPARARRVLRADRAPDRRAAQRAPSRLRDGRDPRRDGFAVAPRR